IVNINLVRDKETGKSKGYAFLQYEDQRSTILAVDNLNGAKVLGRVLRVDHVKGYRQPKRGEGEEPLAERAMNAAPVPIGRESGSPKGETDGSALAAAAESDEVLMQRAGIDAEDPMAEYYLEKYKRRLRKESKRSEESSSNRRHRHRSRERRGSRERESRRHGRKHRGAGDLESGQIRDERPARTLPRDGSSDNTPPSLASRAAHSDKQPMFIGIGGGRGAGKEFTCRYIIDKVRERGYGELAERVVHLHLDDFHRELSAEDGALLEAGKTEINFDHPESFDFELLESVLQQLRTGEPADVPKWDCALKRRVGVRRIECQPRVVLVEGILVLFVKEVRGFMDMQVFVDVDSDTRLGRQVRAMLKAATAEGEGVDAQARESLKRFLDNYLFMAKPSFEEFIWPTKRWADVIIPKGDRNNVAIELIAQRLIDLDHDA
ncbi:hypothetical protein GGF42_003735, partial [Coemansia sp. RSA 2424]